jgi:hypothetical protein
MKLANWTQFFSGDEKKLWMRKAYGRMDRNNKVFSTGSTASRLVALIDSPDIPFLLLCTQENQISAMLLHHASADPDEPLSIDQSEFVFALHGTGPNTDVVKVSRDLFGSISDDESPFFAPSMNSMFAETLLEDPVAEAVLNLEVDEETPVIFPCIIPVPPFAFAVLENFKEHDFPAALVHCLRVLNTWEDQFAESIPNQDLKKDIFRFFQVLWILAKLAGDADSFTNNLTSDLQPRPAITAVKDLPEETIQYYEAITRQYLHVAGPKEAEFLAGGEIPNGPALQRGPGADAQLAFNMAAVDSLESNRATNLSIQQLIQTHNNLLIEQSNRSSGSSAVSGFKKVLRLSARSDGVVPNEPNAFMQQFFAVPKEKATALLQQQFARHHSSMIVSKGLALQVHGGNIIAVNRDQFLQVSLLHFMVPADQSSPSDVLADQIILETSSADYDRVRKMVKMVEQFPSNSYEMIQGLKKCATFFDILADVDPGAQVSSLVGHCLRNLVSSMDQLEQNLLGNKARFPDFFADLANHCDVILHNHLKKCRDSFIFDSSALQGFPALAAELDLGYSMRNNFPLCLIPRLPSSILAMADSSNKRSYSSSQANMDHIAKKSKSDDSSSSSKKNPNVLSALKLPSDLVFTDVFPTDLANTVPKASKDGKQLHFCLKFFCVGHCKFRGCRRFHGTPTATELNAFKTFVQARFAACGGGP